MSSASKESRQADGATCPSARKAAAEALGGYPRRKEMILEKVFEDLQKQDIRQGLHDYKFQLWIHVQVKAVREVMNQMMEAWKQGKKILDERWISLKHNAKLSLSFFRLVKNKTVSIPSSW
ncbi:hypothetical protein YC2023_072567 [Brassica napus]